MSVLRRQYDICVDRLDVRSRFVKEISGALVKVARLSREYGAQEQWYYSGRRLQLHER